MTSAESLRHVIATSILIAGVGISTRDGLALASAGPRWHDLEEATRYGNTENGAHRLYRRADLRPAARRLQLYPWYHGLTFNGRAL